MRIATAKLRTIKRFYGADIAIINGENADINGIRPEQANALYDAGADVVTLGNHTWSRRQILSEIEGSRFLIRPQNYAKNAPGQGYLRIPLRSGRWLCVVNLIGRLNCDWNASNPFYELDALMKAEPEDIFAIDIHAEATSEKAALAYFADGRAGAVFGTHTHVQTADERILPGGTGFITDLGMTGPVESILGVYPHQSVEHFTLAVPQRYESPNTAAKLEGAAFELDEKTGLCVRVERIRIEE